MLLKGPVKIRSDWTIVDTELKASSAESFTFEWVTRNTGFGLITFRAREGYVYCVNDTMSRRFVRSALDKLLEGKAEDRWPLLLRRHGGVDNLLAASTPQQPWVDES